MQLRTRTDLIPTTANLLSLASSKFSPYLATAEAELVLEFS
jgi:hypothetical protein